MWVEYFAKVFGKTSVAVPPQYTHPDRSECRTQVKKSLSTRTDRDSHCNRVLDRDKNTLRNIVMKGLRTVIWA
ncbi:transposase [Oscillatoriales cyanobacterium LEGE 11467]|uniref:Transposase n=1 Tax=Zarconia navalis LEGE 11467 TaxID=1828826 RepID=A0A928W007_9CYAN|nr:transposase [Zarconia navalis LEGE 11467]